MEHYKFNDEQTAVDSEQWMVDKAKELKLAFTDPNNVTKRFAIPQPELDENGEATGKWIYPRIPNEMLVKIPQADALEWLNLFQPEIIDIEV